MSAPPADGDAVPASAFPATAAATPGPAGKAGNHHAARIPPLPKSTATPLSIRRRLDMRLRPNEPDPYDPSVLTQKLNQLALERTTPRKQPHREGEKVPAAVPMPSPGLGWIRERLAATAEKENLPSARRCVRADGADAAARQSVDDDGSVDAQAKAAAAEAEAARAVESIFEQEEELLSAMSSALTYKDKSLTAEGGEDKKDVGKTPNKMKQAMLSRVAKSIEDVTREQLSALPDGLAIDGDDTDIKATAVYWIAMARFEECHDRIDGARKYLLEGIKYVASGDKKGSAGGSSCSMQTKTLRLALERFEQRVKACGANEESFAMTATGKAGSRSPSRSSIGRKSPGKKDNGTAATPTRRSQRIRRKSLERKGADKGGN